MKKLLITLVFGTLLTLSIYGACKAFNPVDTYSYKVTQINGDEIVGMALDHKSNDNAGVILSRKIDNINVKIGDKVAVTFEKGVHDNILKVKKID